MRISGALSIHEGNFRSRGDLLGWGGASRTLGSKASLELAINVEMRNGVSAGRRTGSIFNWERLARVFASVYKFFLIASHWLC